ncbi:hypothetical protein [Aequorivita lipolytica]|uniref:Uncharacterized protein n=1 Tax=Aequorivita lipolytica TaxID=153267 RepID=A0A5C6YQB0_9FLAO|nr:hypothetical protein [Aequorivita lipolytica]TXD69649.1 hypothetical protein ESV24_07390 [Aequorivita lipolytica]SRX51141.1 hypothetical protein AEQU2_01621 [Aequorivita lipolytica]
MKIIKTIAFILLVTTANTALIAQEFQVPKNVILNNGQDYKNYETDVVNAVTWLENTPLNQQSAKRKQVNGFLLQWITGVPDITIDLGEFQTGLTIDIPDLLVAYLGGWIKYAIENPSEKSNKLMGNLAGVKCVLKIYSENVGKGITKSRKLEKLLKLDETALLAYVQKEIQ